MKSSREIIVCLTALVLLSCLFGTAMAGSPAPAQLQTQAPSAPQTATEARERSEAYGQLQSLAEELKLGTLGIFSGGDANGDGSVTVADIFYLINFLFSSGAAPAQGSTVTWKGAWVNTTTYDLHDAVSFEGSSWVSRIASNTGNPPSTSPAQWDLLAAKGEAGTSFTGAAAGGDLSGTYPNPAVATVGGVSAANIATGAAAANAATSADTLNTIVRRDGSGDFSAGNIALSGNLNLRATSSANGKLLQEGNRLLHTFGMDNVFLGRNAGNFTMTGGTNTAIGFSALSSNDTGFSNTASGADALLSNTTGNRNTAIGREALEQNTSGSNNVASGVAALRSNTTGNENTASGAFALANNIIGGSNTANGFQALQNNTASGNTASGASALQSNTTGLNNTASGRNTLFSNTEGFGNTASGAEALQNNTTGSENTASGTAALFSNITGFNNTAIGRNALFNNSGSGNIAVGHSAGQNLTTENNNIHIGNPAVAGDSGTTRIGTAGTHTRAFLAGVRDVTTGMADGGLVLIDSNGQLGTASSSADVKRDIAGLGQYSSGLMKLRPVSFFYRSDAVGIRQYGLIAEEVAEVMPELVQFSPEGEAQTVRYHFLAPLLLNEIQKQQQTIEQQRNQITMLEARLTALEEQSRDSRAENKIVK